LCPEIWATARPYRAAAPNTHFCFGLIYGHHVNADEARRAAFEAMEAGADSIYCAMNFDIVEAMAKDGIPVVGHVGLIPQKARWTGFRAVGKTANEALEVLADVRRYEDAGAFAVEMEVVPEPVATRICSTTPLTVISMGSGGGCDVQYLFAVDVLGETAGNMPRHARAYRDFASEHARLQQERIAAFSEFRADVETGGFPESRECVGMPAVEWRAFQEALENLK
jgi:3-methyl-2-oxobutanoate hydroxymethyltransferase